MTILDIQKALKALGFDPGPLDGIMGRKTRAALIKFQAKHGLPPHGNPDVATLTYLLPGKGNLKDAAYPWYAEATRLLGTQEIVGPKHSSVIMGWAQKLGLWYPSDETAWCGLFVAHCIGATMPDEPLPANPLGARNWVKFGRSLAKPAVGAVAVFWRGSKTGWLGHVGFVKAVGADGKSLEIRGGNQRNSVRDEWLATDRLLDIRWPSTAPLPSGAIPVHTVGSLSENEA